VRDLCYEAAMGPELLGIDHIGVVVTDLAAATRAYGDILGFPITGGETLADRVLSIRFVDTGGSRIELIAPSRDDSEVSAFLSKRGEGLHHVCVRVRDLEATLARMKSAGARLIDDTPKRGAHGRRVAFVHPKAAHGVLLELVEIPDGTDGHPFEEHHG